MNQINGIQIGPWTFDHAAYDADADVLYLSIGEPRPAVGEESPEGHVVLFDAETDEIVGLTLISIRSLIAEHGDDLKISLPAPEHSISSADLGRVLEPA